MTKQFENPEVTKLEDETASNLSPQQKIDRVAEKAAEKPAKTEQKYDQEHPIFTK
jgi:hypothetical protein